MKHFTEGAVTAGLTPSLLAWGPAEPHRVSPRGPCTVLFGKGSGSSGSIQPTENTFKQVPCR